MKRFTSWMKALSIPSLTTALMLGVAAPAGMVAVAGMSGCDSNDGPAEKAGEKIDQGVDNTKDTFNDATDGD